MEGSARDKQIGIDEIDLLILELLKKNAKMKMQDIGEKVHLTGQAVSNRINKMEKLGVIKGYKVILNKEFLPDKILAFITIFMKKSNHGVFKQYFDNTREIIEAHRISGDGCYMLKVEADSQQRLSEIVDELLEFGTYKVNISIDQLK